MDERAIARRAARLARAPAAEGEARMAALLQVIALMDLTTLSGDDTADRVRRLCTAARHPLGDDLLEALAIPSDRVRVAAVCVYHRFIETAIEALEGSDIRVATVSGGFPHGLSPLAQRIGEIESSVTAGAAEIDAVITRELVLTERWDELYDEVRAFREACSGRLLKMILATGELGTLTNVARASRVCMMAGADFIKTSTGKERVNATLPVGLTMAGEIRAYAGQTGRSVGLKPAGGIRTAAGALLWLSLVREELGPEWLTPERLRFGASSLLADVTEELEGHVRAMGPP